VGLDAGGEAAFGSSMEPKPPSFAHGLDPGLDSVRLPPSGGNQNEAVFWMPVLIAEIAPDQPVKLIV
jgi:hypothetical protein